MQGLLSKLCTETYAEFSVSDLTGHYFVRFWLVKNLSALNN